MQGTYICHHGTQGMKWGKRLYQYEDGSLTPLGRIRYGSGNGKKSSVKSQGSKNQNRSTTTTKTTSNSDSSSESEKPNYSSKARAKNIDEMTDAELGAYIERIRKERTYAELMKEPPQKKKVSAGRQFVEDVLYTSGKSVATTLATQGMTYAGAKLLNNMTGNKGIFKVKGDNKDNK